MQARTVVTRFSDFGKPAAIVTLALLVAAIVLTVLVSFHTTVPPGAVSDDQGDLALYKKIFADMKGGADYYVAAHDRMVANDYGTLSVFNWRTPFLPSLVSLFPSLFWAQMLLAGLAAGAAAVMARLMFKLGGWQLAVTALALMAVNLIGCLAPGTVLFSEMGAGVLIMASAAFYGLKRPGWGFATAAPALFIRELAGAYVLICMYAAWRDKRYRELAGWGAVLLAYAVYFGWHYYNVQLHIGPDDIGYKTGWLQLGGLPFILTTAAFNGFFIQFPLWATAIVLPMAILGILAWPAKTGEHARLAVIVYIGLFAFAGKSFNDYWGALYTPLMMVGLTWFPLALDDLLRALARSRR